LSSGVRLWRIAQETRTYKATALSGAGSAVDPGRWNAAGESVVYTAAHLSLAVLETAAYVNPAGLPLNRFVVAIDVPHDDWARREELDPAKLDPAWLAIPAGKASVDIGSAWYRSARSLLLVVPSAIVPEERNVIINAKHSRAAALSATVVRPFSYVTLFRARA
jgi:RES domain-containing protein